MKLIICLQTTVKCSSNRYYHFSFVWQGIPKLPKIQNNNSSECLYNISKKEVGEELDFLNVDKHKIFLQVDFITLGITVSSQVTLSLLLDMINHFQCTQSNNFVISLQYLKKKLRMEFIFCMQISIKVCTSWDYCFLIETARYVESTKNKMLVIFL